MVGFGKILLVENDIDYAEMIQEMLLKKDPDCIISHAKDGVEAISMMSLGYRPDMIISDKKMPRMNGQELLLTVKTNKDLSSIPFFLLSGNSNQIELMNYADRSGGSHTNNPSNVRDIDMLILRLVRNITDA
jgi:two-component system, sensor histidine kinase ChiS